MRRQLLQQMVKNLPAAAQKRVKAMKNLQLDYLNMESKFFEEVSSKKTFRKFQKWRMAILLIENEI